MELVAAAPDAARLLRDEDCLRAYAWVLRAQAEALVVAEPVRTRVTTKYRCVPHPG